MEEKRGLSRKAGNFCINFLDVEMCVIQTTKEHCIPCMSLWDGAQFEARVVRVAWCLDKQSLRRDA